MSFSRVRHSHPRNIRPPWQGVDIKRFAVVRDTFRILCNVLSYRLCWRKVTTKILNGKEKYKKISKKFNFRKKEHFLPILRTL